MKTHFRAAQDVLRSLSIVGSMYNQNPTGAYQANQVMDHNFLPTQAPTQFDYAHQNQYHSPAYNHNLPQSPINNLAESVQQLQIMMAQLMTNTPPAQAHTRSTYNPNTRRTSMANAPSTSTNNNNNNNRNNSPHPAHNKSRVGRNTPVGGRTGPSRPPLPRKYGWIHAFCAHCC